MLVDFLLRVNMEDILVYWIYPKWNLVIRSYVRRFIFSMMFGRVNLNVSFLLSVRVSKILKYPILPKWKTDKMFSENHLFPKPLSSTILFKGRAINRSAFCMGVKVKVRFRRKRNRRSYLITLKLWRMGYPNRIRSGKIFKADRSIRIFLRKWWKNNLKPSSMTMMIFSTIILQQWSLQMILLRNKRWILKFHKLGILNMLIPLVNLPNENIRRIQPRKNFILLTEMGNKFGRRVLKLLLSFSFIKEIARLCHRDRNLFQERRSKLWLDRKQRKKGQTKKLWWYQLPKEENFNWSLFPHWNLMRLLTMFKSKGRLRKKQPWMSKGRRNYNFKKSKCSKRTKNCSKLFRKSRRKRQHCKSRTVTWAKKEIQKNWDKV